MTFIEGVISFISPCILPMLPIYLAYFAGRGEGTGSPLIGAGSFVAGFSAVFITLGAFAASIGVFLSSHMRAVNIIGGLLLILIGINYTGLVRIPFLNRHLGLEQKPKIRGPLSAFLFGIVFAVGWTPCVGAFLGSALMIAANSATVWTGVLLLACFSLGLGIPFMLSAVLIEQLKSSLRFIKRHYAVINAISGVLLIVTGLAMALGLLGKLLNLVAI